MTDLRFQSAELDAIKGTEQYYLLPVPKVAELLKTNSEQGLSKGEAIRRRQRYGKNTLEVQKERPLWRLIIDQFLSPLVWILLFAVVLAFVFGEYLEGIAIVLVILINAGIGFGMEWQAVRSMEALRKMTQINSRVIRDGQMSLINAEELVPGDLVFLEAGDMVPADCRLVQAVNLSMNEGVLTGESTTVGKEITALSEEQPLADQSNMIFKSTGVARGNAHAIVVATGMQTAFGQIVKLTGEASSEITPLEQKLNVFSQKLIWLTLAIAGVIIVVGLLQGRTLYLMIETAIALAIAAIPEGLPIVATIALARGMLRLADSHAVVKKLSAVETLGETQVILTDKTGTLTENKLMPDTLVFDFDEASIVFRQNNLEWVDSEKSYLAATYAFRQLQKVATLCNNASLGDGKEETTTGDPLEIALLKLVNGESRVKDEISSTHPRLNEIPFDSQTKMMGTLHRNGDRPDYLVCIKGALEVVLEESDFVLTKEGQKILKDKQAWTDKANELAAQGIRVLAFAYAEIDEPREDFFQHLVFIGMVGFLDPPRDGIKEAVETCHQAGIRVVMLTGDHPETAKHIAMKTGLVKSSNTRVIHGKGMVIDDKSEASIKNLLETNVFARVSPKQKLDLVQFFQSQGLIVGMTGDGVNDTPALKKADIGIAMGKRGTEAAKEVADLVLEDDSFSTIVLAIRQGREIFQNIRHFVIYLLSCNLSELLVVFIAFLVNAPSPLLPLQILFINMVTDVYPALALGLNKGAANVMQREPRDKQSLILNPKIWRIIVIYSITITSATIASFLFALYYLELGPALANNFAFYTITLAQLWHVFNLPKPPASFFNNEVVNNRYIWLAVLLCLTILIVAYSIPLVRDVLSLQAISLVQLGWIFLFSIMPVVIVQVVRFFIVLSKSDKNQ